MCLDKIDKKCFDQKKVRSKTLIAKYKNKTSYILNNNQCRVVSKVDFDNCKGHNESICDYLFIVESKIDRYIFVELKDSNVSKAISQIKSTIEKYKECLQSKRIDCRIITTKTNAPDLKTNEYKKFLLEIKRSGGNLITNSQTYKEAI